MPTAPTIAPHAFAVIGKQNSETRSSNNTLADDAELKLTMAPNATYRIRLTVFYTSNGTADFKYATTGPGSPTQAAIRYSHVVPGASANSNFVVTSASVGSTAINGSTTDPGYIVIEMIWENGANAAVFAFQWAQNTSDASNTTVRKGSTLEWMVV